jgi:hypothetical protein
MKLTVCRAVPVRMVASPQALSRRHGSTGVARDGGAAFVGAKALRRRLGQLPARPPDFRPTIRDGSLSKETAHRGPYCP